MGSRTRRWIKRIGAAFLIVMVTIGAVEAGLAFFDPLGARYFNEQNALFSVSYTHLTLPTSDLV